jgi:hypothetical protein
MDGMVRKRNKLRTSMNAKIIGLDGKIYPWNPKSGSMANKEQSSYHLLAKKVIKTIYPLEPLLEEVSLPGTKPTLYADFIIPLRNILIEVHGEQHYNWVMRFHPTKKDFILGKRRDRIKKEWAELNKFYFVELPYWENENEWRYRIINIGKE